MSKKLNQIVEEAFCDLYDDSEFREYLEAVLDVRYSDPDTSHDAADTIDVTKNENMVYRAILKTGKRGATWDELVELTNMPRQSISPRLKPLRELGLIYVPSDGDGDLKRMGEWGKMQLVHVARRAAQIKD